ncbi:MAG: STT3 domain-containing protein, partial [Candidatus Bathyarchaeia archaeon]
MRFKLCRPTVASIKGSIRSLIKSMAIWLKALWIPISLAAICILAFYVRIQPVVRVWDLGFYLHEYDTYFQYRVTERILREGLSSWYNWHDTRSWYPYGRDIARSSYIGLPLAGAAFYRIIELLGVGISLMEALVFFPPVMAIFMCISIFLLGREIGGSIVGLTSSLLLAIAPANISRTFAGWYDDESVGILAFILTILFYVKAVKSRDLRIGPVYGLIAGLSLGYLIASWGSSFYVLALIALSTFIAMLISFDKNLVIAYIPIVAVSMLIAIQIPKVGYGFIYDSTALLSYGVAALLLLKLGLRRLDVGRGDRIFLAILGLLALCGVALVATGMIRLPGGKYLAVLNPIYKREVALIRSVGEHQSTTWAQIFMSTGFLSLFIPFYMIQAFRKRTFEHILVSVWAVTSLYFTASFARLELLLAPAISIVAAYSLYEISQPLISYTRSVGRVRRSRKMLYGMRRDLAVASIILIAMLALLPVAYFVYITYFYYGTLPSILELSARYNRPYTDWVEALAWMRENIGGRAIVLSWWDYGYWITVLGNCTTLADNATINSTQIAVIAKAFISPENASIPIMERYNVTHIVVFTSWTAIGQQTGLFVPDGMGEEGKFVWMIRIANDEFGGFNETDYIDTSVGAPSSRFYESVLGSIIPFRFYTQ